jgi:hypothetical protein
MATAAPAPIAATKPVPLGRLLTLLLHTLTVYMLAIYISPVLVGRWFAWGLPMLGVHTAVASRDWYLQHLELVTIFPAFIAGCINLARFLPATVAGQIRENEPTGVWAWAVPALALLIAIAKFRAASLDSYGSLQSSLRYFFVIQTHMITWQEIVRADFSSDPARIFAQRFITAPFYAGLAYSLGALTSKYHIWRRLFEPDQPDAPLLPDGIAGEFTPEPPSSLAD